MRPAPLTARTSHDAVLELRPTAAGWDVLLDAEHLGWVRLTGAGPRPMLEVELAAEHRGRGYASASVRAVARWALDPAGGGLDVLGWQAPVGDWSARRLAWACGSRVEGQVRGLLHRDGAPVDGWVGSLTAGDAVQPLLPWYEPPRLRLGAVLLRPNCADDAQRIAEACSDPLIQHFLPLLPRGYSRRDAEDFLLWQAQEQASGAGLHWAVVDADEPSVLLGQVGLTGLQAGLSPAAEIGYWMHPDARGRGLTRTAVRAVCRHALLGTVDGGLGLSRVLLRAATSNPASVQVARTAGLRESGRDRCAERLGDGTLDDHLRFELVADDLDDAWAHPAALR